MSGLITNYDIRNAYPHTIVVVVVVVVAAEAGRELAGDNARYRLFQVGAVVRSRYYSKAGLCCWTECSVLCRHRKSQSKKAERQNGFDTGMAATHLAACNLIF